MNLPKLILAVTIFAAVSQGAQAQTPAEFYRGKQVSLYIGFSPGGTYDLYGRVVARHIGKHIPGNPTVIPRNMEGAGSIRLTNYMYQQAPKDGTAFATMGRGGAFGPLFGMTNAQFDASGSAAPTTRSASVRPGIRPASRPSTRFARRS